MDNSPQEFLTRPDLGKNYPAREKEQQRLIELPLIGKMLRFNDEDPLNFESYEGKEKVNHPLSLSEELPVGSVIQIRDRYLKVVDPINRAARKKHPDTTFVIGISREEYLKMLDGGAKGYSLSPKKNEFKLPLSQNPQNDYFLNPQAK